MTCRDILVNLNQIELEDDPLGVIDTPLEYSYLGGRPINFFNKEYGSDPFFN